MAITFSEPMILRETMPQPGLAAFFGKDAAEQLHQALGILRECFLRTEAPRPWGLALLPVEDCLVFYRGEQRSGAWTQTLQIADFRELSRNSAELYTAEILPPQGHLLPQDERFLEALRDAAFLTCLAPGTVLFCIISEEQQYLTEAVFGELLTSAVPAEHLRYLSFIAGTGTLPQVGFQFCVTCQTADPEGEDAPLAAHVGVDFTASPAMLELRFQALNFAQRTVRSLLPKLGLSVLLSMWNAAERTVIETVGEAAVDSPDLIAWELLRRNFAMSKFPITKEEQRTLHQKVEDFLRQEELLRARRKRARASAVAAATTN